MLPRLRRTPRGAAAAIIAALLAGPVLAVPASAVEAPPTPGANPEVRGTGDPQPSDRFIVKFEDRARVGAEGRGNAYGPAAAALGIAVQELKATGTGATVVETSRELTAGESAAFLDTLEADVTVEYAEPDRIMQTTSLSPADELYEYQWPIFDRNAGIDADKAWDTTTGEGITVAVVDTGITAHADLDANVLPGHDMIADPARGRDGDGRDADATDEGDYGHTGECGTASSSWHGTHVAGTIAAVANTEGVVGIAPGARILPVRAVGECGGWMSDIIDGVIWASGGSVPGVPSNTTPAQAVNLSVAGDSGCSTSWQRAIDGAVGRGSVIVAAVGNDNKNAASTYPANCDHVIAVAASGQDGAKAPYSNYGDVVDVMAPGGTMDVDTLGGVLSTINMGASAPVEDHAGQAYGFYQGTSTAAPHVSATVALMLAANPTLGADAIEARLKATTGPLPIPCEWGCGAGLINARAAVDAALTGDVPTAPEPGTVIVPGAVVITGTPSVDSTLTVEIGAWEPAPVDVALQWFRDGELIPGATGVAYELAPADVHRSMHVVATGTRPGFPDARVESPRTRTVQPGTLTSVAPRVDSTGEHVVGTTLTILPGTWQPAPVAIRYQWYRGAAPIPNAINAGYTLSTGDIGQSVRADVIGEKAGYLPVTRGTVPTDLVGDPGMTPGLPTVAGTIQVGQTLTATSGEWFPAPESFLYEWLADGRPIVEGGISRTYTLRPGDVDRRISVTVTGLRSGAIPASATSVATAPVGRGVLAGPVPVIKGTAAFGRTLTVDVGSWPPGTALGYRWLRDGVVLAGRIGPTYPVAVEDIGHRISVQVVGSKPGYETLTRDSAPAGAVTAGTLTAPIPTVSGSTRVGDTLTADPGDWTAGTTFRYQWYRSGIPIAGATGVTIALTAIDLGKSVSVRVTGSMPGYTTVLKYSAWPGAVAAGSMAATKPTVAGTTRVGSVLTANSGTWTAGSTFTYQWFRTGVPIAGATGARYTLTSADLGKAMSVGVTGSQTGYNSILLYSLRTANVTTGSMVAAKPTVSGTTRMNYSLTANPGSWTAGSSFSYQWFRTGVPIRGATGRTYKLTSADLGRSMSVGVTGSKAGYNSILLYSARTGSVAR
ncbi:S8 family serine peptidase [Arthrobacter sp. B0490]|uniref:S8 family serine peptidase n=1 Tax=Arthrobacter sp. B0490 TaxID=2058891 RepID=UPI000CE4EC95|nr:S8 family serine peptidase [Arthrobacter sp. B0490]